MDMNAQARNSLLTAMVCVALSSGTAWAATPELNVPPAAAQPQAANMVQSDSRAMAKQAAELREMPLRWQAVPTSKDLEREAKPQPVIITADDIKAQRKAERRKITAESVRGQAQNQAQPQPMSQVQQVQDSQIAAPLSQPAVKQVQPEQKQALQSAEPVPQPAPKQVQPEQRQALQSVKPVPQPAAEPVQEAQAKPVQALQPAKQVAETRARQPVQPLQEVQPVQQPATQARPAQPLQAVPQPAVMQARPVQQPQPVQSVPQANIMQVRSVQPQRSVQADEPGPLKQALQRLREQDSATGARPRPAAADSAVQAQQKPLPQIRTAQDAKQPIPARPAQRTSVQPAQPALQPAQPARRQEQPHSTVLQPRSSGQLQVERPPEFANVSDEVVRHILAGEFAMMHQLRQDPTEPGVYKLTQILNKNTGLTHLQKIEYLIGFGRAINRSSLTEWQKSALIMSVIEAFE